MYPLFFRQRTEVGDVLSTPAGINTNFATILPVFSAPIGVNWGLWRGRWRVGAVLWRTGSFLRLCAPARCFCSDFGRRLTDPPPQVRFLFPVGLGWVGLVCPFVRKLSCSGTVYLLRCNYLLSFCFLSRRTCMRCVFLVCPAEPLRPLSDDMACTYVVSSTTSGFTIPACVFPCYI